MSEQTSQFASDRPSAGRVYDYILGGTHNSAVDREFAEQQLALLPSLRESIVENRRFLGRAVRFAVNEGIRQFVDIGSGLPTEGSVHQVADEAAPGECRVVYVDNEPMAHAHSNVLLEQHADPDRHHALYRDFFDGSALWQDVAGNGWIDPEQPTCLLTVALLHFMPHEPRTLDTLAYYRERLAPGSLLVLSHASVDPADDPAQKSLSEIAENYRQKATHDAYLRDRAQIMELFGQFELVEPGLTWLNEWRPDTPPKIYPPNLRALCGVGRKP
ncbi:SAM-dependent methyltransferase [Prauserella flavalba]|uniref:Polyketide biosynthesis methyltransferase n=1 Tax=Prauserella flavalba TaxID=1477506 RepID=A0A318M1H7_9PSEU|nr:SAM-dependent methyltransferase [Prauserella flavalba]PXY38559.1 polyketide biosynthesis methyltransferase [Prauserella flavalba]